MKTITFKRTLIYLFISSCILYSLFESLYSIGFVDKTVALHEVPSKVRTIIKEHLQNGKLVSLSLNNEQHGLHYDAIIRIDDGTDSLEISPLGKMIDETILYNKHTATEVIHISAVQNYQKKAPPNISTFTIPSAITAQVHQQYPYAFVERKEKIEDNHYRIVLNYQGSVVECIYNANGHLDTLQPYSPSEYLKN